MGPAQCQRSGLRRAPEHHFPEPPCGWYVLSRGRPRQGLGQAAHPPAPCSAVARQLLLGTLIPPPSQEHPGNLTEGLWPPEAAASVLWAPRGPGHHPLPAWFPSRQRKLTHNSTFIDAIRALGRVITYSQGASTSCQPGGRPIGAERLPRGQEEETAARPRQRPALAMGSEATVRQAALEQLRPLAGPRS